MRWLNRQYPEWFHEYEIRKGVGAFVNELLLTELCKRYFLQRELFPWEIEAVEEYETPPYSYQISDFGRAYLEALPGELIDRWFTRIFALWGAITGTIAVIVEVCQYLQSKGD